jgi:hypothetical protein
MAGPAEGVVAGIVPEIYGPMKSLWRLKKSIPSNSKVFA